MFSIGIREWCKIIEEKTTNTNLNYDTNLTIINHSSVLLKLIIKLISSFNKGGREIGVQRNNFDVFFCDITQISKIYLILLPRVSNKSVKKKY